MLEKVYVRECVCERERETESSLTKKLNVAIECSCGSDQYLHVCYLPHKIGILDVLGFFVACVTQR